MTRTSEHNVAPPILTGRILVVASAVWFVMTVLAVFTLVTAVPVMRSFVTEGTFAADAIIVAPDFIVRATNIASLILVVGSTVLSMGLSTLLIWRAERNFMVVFTSIFLMGYSVIVPGPLEAAVRILPDPFTSEFSMVVNGAYFASSLIWLLWIFPNGGYQPRWTRYLVIPMLILSIGFSIWTGGQGADQPSEMIFQVLLMAAIALSFAGQVYRYFRLSTLRERQQVRLVLVGIVLMFVLQSVGSIGWTPDPTVPMTSWRFIGSTIWSLSMSVIPIFLAVAVLRYRLWAVDLIIRRTLQYGLITLLLASVYFGGVVLLQSIFVRITGQESTLAIVASTLAIAALFNPVRNRVQSFIDRRFDRRKYDARRTLDEFAASARDEVDLDRLQRSLVNVVEETLQPESVSLWIQGEG